MGYVCEGRDSRSGVFYAPAAQQSPRRNELAIRVIFLRPQRSKPASQERRHHRAPARAQRRASDSASGSSAARTSLVQIA